LPRNKGEVKLEKVTWEVPAEYPLGGESVVPLRAGQTLAWRLAPR
jgi:dihydroorotase